MLLKIGDKLVKYEDLFNVEVIENYRKVMEGNIVSIIKKIDGSLLEFERRADEFLKKKFGGGGFG